VRIIEGLNGIPDGFKGVVLPGWFDGTYPAARFGFGTTTYVNGKGAKFGSGNLFLFFHRKFHYLVISAVGGQQRETPTQLVPTSGFACVKFVSTVPNTYCIRSPNRGEAKGAGPILLFA
jgi:hypothetical protein